MQLFFYGVLQQAVASPAIRAMLSGIGEGQPASVEGVLMAVPDAEAAYPVLLAGEGTVHGMLHDAGTVDLAALDAFEGAEYRRSAIVAVLTDGERVQAEAYRYVAEPQPDFIPIPHGNFAQWLAETGRRPLAARD